MSRTSSKFKQIIPLAGFGLLAALLFFLAIYFWNRNPLMVPLSEARTLYGFNRELAEPFGIAIRGGSVFISDGEAGKILRIGPGDDFAVVTDKLDTPSAIAFDENGDLIVADSGAHAIRRVIIRTGEVETIAGTVGKNGFADGDALDAQFNAPVGVAVSEDGKIFVADTYNDRIRVIEDNRVSTLAGSTEGFADGNGDRARFDLPCGLALTPEGDLVVADAGNFRIRVVGKDGVTRTFAGSGEQASVDGLLTSAAFVRPTALAFDARGLLYVADGNSIRVIGNRALPFVETLTATEHGYSDGTLPSTRFGRPSGLAGAPNGDVMVADSDNQAVRILTAESAGSPITAEQLAARRFTAEEFRSLGEPRWPFNPADNAREIAGTLGEIRGEIEDGESAAWFHNGLDITGGYGERVRLIRKEKVLDPFAVQNFTTNRELLRMPTIGYIHIRVGRNVNSAVFADPRFQFRVDGDGDLRGLRIARGTVFEAGEALGTLNPMNHVHLVAGRRSAEMNALDAIVLPDIADSRPPTIEGVELLDENWKSLETKDQKERISIPGRTRIVVSAYDQMDGNADRRRLGVYRLGYQLFRDGEPTGEITWTISFDRMPPDEAVSYVYASGSRSGATGQTTFKYIASNEVNGDGYRESFLDTSGLENGEYTLRIYAADFFANQAFADVLVKVAR